MSHLPPLPLIALPVLPVVLTPDFPINGPDYQRPLRDGYYELKQSDGKWRPGDGYERRFYSVRSDTWMCVGGAHPWMVYSAWRGVVGPEVAAC